MKSRILLICVFFSCSFLSCSESILKDTSFDETGVSQGDTLPNRIDRNLSFRGHPIWSRFTLTGDTVLKYRSIELVRPSKTSDLQNLRNQSRQDKPFRMVVFGGSLGAGVRDGGLFNEGMETSFGSLLANQMGIVFINPLFDLQDFNGFGRIALTSFNPTGGPIPKYKKVINNTGIESDRNEPNGNAVLKPTRLKYDNYSFPYGSFISQGESEDYIKGTNPNITPLIKRLNHPDITAEIKEGNAFDFFILEIPEMDQNILALGLGSSVEDFKKYMNDFKEFDNGNPPTLPLGAKTTDLYYRNFFKKMQQVGAKGIVLNLPHVYDLPFFQQNYREQLLNIVNEYQLYDLAWKGGISELKISTDPIPGGILNADIIYGYSSLDSLLSPHVNINLKPGLTKNRPVTLGFHGRNDVEKMKQERRYHTENFNKIMQEAVGYPVVDLMNIYQNISSGLYTTDDGVAVTAKWPGGNFFSSDGMNPSAFGHAVITNEIIKVINKYYRLDIPLISTQQFIVKR